MYKFNYSTKGHRNNKLIFLLSIIATCLIIICDIFTNKKNVSVNNTLRASTIIATDEQTEDIDILIGVNLAHTEDEDMKKLIDAEYESVYETNNDIYIDINSDYYKKYISGHRFMAPKIPYFDNSENVEHLTMTFDIVNNTDERLSIDKLNIMVEESTPDTIPVIYICTTEDCSNCIYFVNESWFNWNGFTFDYSILKKGESFNGVYKKSRHISYFDKFTIVDLLPEMKDMGYNFDELVNHIRDKNIRLNRENNRDWDVEPIDSVGNYYFLTFYLSSNDADFNLFQEKFKPFELKESKFKDEYVGTASLYGSIRFDHSDFKVDFVAEISLSTAAGFGGLSYANDKFDVKLKTIGNNYILQYPYTTIIEPKGTEMIKLSITADISSSHKFYVDINNDNGLKVRSKNIHFHHYYPKN